MVEQWIPTKQALEIVDDERAIMQRLSTGLVKSRAKMLWSNAGKFADKRVEADFWEVDRYSEFNANWETGDFSKCLDGEGDVYAFSVTIELTGILAMLPFEERASTARSLSVAGNSEWLSAKDAQTLCFDSHSPMSIGAWIIAQGKLGFVTARAVQAELRRVANSDGFEWLEREWDVPVWFWDSCTKSTSSNQSWATGRFTSTGRTPMGSGVLTLNGVYFHKRAFFELLGKPLVETPELPLADTEQSKRGRKPYYDWPVAMSTVWGRLLNSEWSPKVQAEVEQALISALRVGDKEPSESTVRPFAKAIFEEYSKP